MSKHDGCHRCKSMEQAVLKSKLTTYINKKGVQESGSIALCDKCWEKK